MCILPLPNVLVPLKYSYQNLFPDSAVIEATLDLVLSCCVLHEMNRQNLMKNGLLDRLDAVFDKHKVQGKVGTTNVL